MLPFVGKFPYLKEILPFGRKKEGDENCKEMRNFEMSKEFTKNSRINFTLFNFHVLIDFCASYILVLAPEIF